MCKGHFGRMLSRCVGVLGSVNCPLFLSPIDFTKIRSPAWMMDAHQKNYALIAMSYTCFFDFMETDPVPAGKCQALKGKIFFPREVDSGGSCPIWVQWNVYEAIGIEKYSCLSKKVFLHNQLSVLEPPWLQSVRSIFNSKPKKKKCVIASFQSYFNIWNWATSDSLGLFSLVSTHWSYR